MANKQGWHKQKKRHSEASQKGWIKRKRTEKSKQWTPEREKALNRRPDGTFDEWKGGRKLKDLKKKQNNFQGIAIHIGKEFNRQNKRNATTGEIVRTRKKDGSFHRGAEWYIKTGKGWRKFGPKKPNKTQIKIFNEVSRKGRL